MGPMLLNEVGRIEQHVSKNEGRKEGKDGIEESKSGVSILALLVWE